VFQEEYRDALALADEVVLAEVFAKDSDPIPAQERLDPARIERELVAAGTPCRTLPDPPAIRDYLAGSAQAGDVIVIMSNGAFGGLPKLMAEAVGA
jgi:UDP-N-acetylmuramate: L-alanyl-gamma-D-glutamyl-meso-diaminopimelate ligase